MSGAWAHRPAGTRFAAAARAGGADNAARKLRRNWRRVQIVLRLAGQARRRGLQARLALELGVSPATISRDFRAIRDADQGALLA